MQSAYRPLLKTTYAEKKANDWELAKKEAEYFSSRCRDIISWSRAERLYKLANDEYDERLYRYVTNPLNTDKPELQGYPSKMRNMGIIKDIVQLIMGEKSNRPFVYSVIAKNSDLQSKQLEAELQGYIQQLRQIAYNEMADAGMAPEDIKAQPTPPEIIRKQASNMPDEMSIMGQEGLDYVVSQEEVEHKLLEAWYHYIVTNIAITYKYPVIGGIDYEVVPPREISTVMDSSVRWLEDAEAVKRTFRRPVTWIIDKLQDEEGFTKELAEYLLGTLDGGNGVIRGNGPGSKTVDEILRDNAYAQLSKNLWGSTGFDTKYSDEEGVLLEHLTWTSQRKILTVSGIDILGMPYEFEADEDYIIGDDEEVEERWESEEWETWIIDERFYVGIKPIEFHRKGAKRGSSKKCYNGRIMFNPYTEGKSLVEMGENYQIKVNIFNYFLEKLIAKNKDKILIYPESITPEKEGWSHEHNVYYMDADSILYVDDSKRSAGVALQSIHVLDMSLNNHISTMMEFIRFYKSQYEEKVGITRQRKGEVNSSDGKATTEQAIYRGSLMSEFMFKEFEYFQGKDLQGLMDLSQVAYQDGLYTAYINSDFQRVYIRLSPDKYCFGPFGVQIVHSAKEIARLEKLRDNGQAFAQNNVKPSVIAKILSTDNYAKIVQYIEQMEDEMYQQMQAKDEAANAAIVKAEELKKEIEDNRNKTTIYKVDTERLTEQDKINASFLLQDMKETGVADVVALEKISLERQKMIQDAKDAKEERENKKEIKKMDVQIARTNKN